MHTCNTYSKWLYGLEKKYRGKATRVWFKNKELGWNQFSTRVDFDNGRVYRKDRYHDLYMKGYLEKNLYIRPSCSKCHFKGLPREADITLAVRTRAIDTVGYTSRNILFSIEEEVKRVMDLATIRIESAPMTPA